LELEARVGRDVRKCEFCGEPEPPRCERCGTGYVGCAGELGHLCHPCFLELLETVYRPKGWKAFG
jgi:hypothetical protein